MKRRKQDRYTARCLQISSMTNSTNQRSRTTFTHEKETKVKRVQSFLRMIVGNIIQCYC